MKIKLIEEILNEDKFIRVEYDDKNTKSGRNYVYMVVADKDDIDIINQRLNKSLKTNDPYNYIPDLPTSFNNITYSEVSKQTIKNDMDRLYLSGIRTSRNRSNKKLNSQVQQKYGISTDDENNEDKNLSNEKFFVHHIDGFEGNDDSDNLFGISYSDKTELKIASGIHNIMHKLGITDVTKMKTPYVVKVAVWNNSTNSYDLKQLRIDMKVV